MADTTARLLRLLSLLQTRRTWSGHELLDRLAVSERTLRRDVDRLRELGYPVAATPGPFGGYQLGAGTDIPPLLLDDDEAVAIAMGLLTAAGGTITGIEETSLRALSKLENVLPPRIRRRINMLQSAVVPMIRAWVKVDAEILTTVAQACRDHERLRFEYTSRQGEDSERHVEPHQLVSLRQRWYLVAFDRERDDWRTFRLDRIKAPRATKFDFKPRAIPGGDAASYVTESLRSIPTRYRVLATIAVPASEVANKLRDATVEAIDDDRCLIRLDGDHLEWLAFQITWLGVDFVIHEPEELVDYMGDLSGRLARSLSAEGRADAKMVEA
ncbi:MAG: helix-turn-helix transcriptional regulator [Acidimicrobiia bacterium]